MSKEIFDRIYGCIAGSNIGAAMGAPVEGYTVEEIKRRYGKVDKLMPWGGPDAFNDLSIFQGLSPLRMSKDGKRFRFKWTDFFSGEGLETIEERAGMTEDGIERQKLLATAIIEKKSRITLRDLIKIWLRDIKEENIGKLYPSYDAIYYYLAKAGLPPEDIGKYNYFPGQVTFAVCCQPIAIINACNPEHAYKDAMEIGKVYMSDLFLGLDWQAAIAAATSEALKSDATVESVLKASMAYVKEAVADDIEEGLKFARQFKNVYDMLEPFNNRDPLKAYCFADEIVVRALCIFYLTKGAAKEGIIAAVNSGRDTDCTATIVGALAGAFSGVKAIPKEWIATVDKATKNDKRSVSHRTLKETAEGLHEALLHHVKSMKKQAGYIEGKRKGKSNTSKNGR